MAHLYKSRLQNYAQKRNIPFPTYACEMQGPPHARQFKARVTVDGVTYEGPEFCSTLKEAEHSAAKVAFMSFSPAEAQEDDCLYKSLLQEVAQKKGLRLPIYATNRTGPPHMPCFLSNVEISGERFVGQEARTKKQAEMNAAKVAYTTLSEGGPRVNAMAVTSDIHPVVTSDFGPVVTVKKEPNLVSTANKIQIGVKDQSGYSMKKETDKVKGEAMENHMLFPQPIMGSMHDSGEAMENHMLFPQPIMGHESKKNPTPNGDATKKTVVQEYSSIQAGQTQEGPGSNGKRNQADRSFVKEEAPSPVTDLGSVIPSGTKIVIRPNKPGMILDGPIEFADDDWVATRVSLDENK